MYPATAAPIGGCSEKVRRESMATRKCLRGAAWAATAVMVCTFVPGSEASAAERAVRQQGASNAAPARRAERTTPRKAADQRSAAKTAETAPAKKTSPDPAKNDDSTSWISIYPTEQ